jgi:hypothetical protein
MNIILSTVIAVLVAVSFTTVVFAKDADKPVIIAEPNSGSTNGDVQKTFSANTKEKTDTDAAISKARNDSNDAQTKAKNDYDNAISKARNDSNDARAKARTDSDNAASKARSDVNDTISKTKHDTNIEKAPILPAK